MCSCGGNTRKVHDKSSDSCGRKVPVKLRRDVTIWLLLSCHCCCRLMEQSEAEDDQEDDDASFSWLKEMGVQDQINKPDSVSIKLYPLLSVHGLFCFYSGDGSACSAFGHRTTTTTKLTEFKLISFWHPQTVCPVAGLLMYVMYSRHYFHPKFKK